jgi:hypothetical protein
MSLPISTSAKRTKQEKYHSEMKFNLHKFADDQTNAIKTSLFAKNQMSPKKNKPTRPTCTKLVR